LGHFELKSAQLGRIHEDKSITIPPACDDEMVRSGGQARTTVLGLCH